MTNWNCFYRGMLTCAALIAIFEKAMGQAWCINQETNWWWPWYVTVPLALVALLFAFYPQITYWNYVRRCRADFDNRYKEAEKKNG